MKSLTPYRETVKLRAITRQGVAQRLRAWRESAGLSQKALGKALGVHHNTIAAWELGENCPRLDTMAQIANYYAIDWHYIIAGALPRGVPPYAVAQAQTLLAQALGVTTYQPPTSQQPPPTSQQPLATSQQHLPQGKSTAHSPDAPHPGTGNVPGLE